MQTLRTSLPTLAATLGAILGALAIIAAATTTVVQADDDDDDRRWIKPGKDVAPVTNPVYRDECGACHFAYQPGLLAAADWQRIMTPTALGEHYGDDATLDDQTRRALARYLNDNAADRARGYSARGFAGAASPGDGLPRITTSRYFVKKHDEVPDRLVTGNPDVGSFGNCGACHRGADDGVFNEKQVNIPGHGRWDD